MKKEGERKREVIQERRCERCKKDYGRNRKKNGMGGREGERENERGRQAGREGRKKGYQMLGERRIGLVRGVKERIGWIGECEGNRI